jgi:hypothetical protein
MVLVRKIHLVILMAIDMVTDITINIHTIMATVMDIMKSLHK